MDKIKFKNDRARHSIDVVSHSSDSGHEGGIRNKSGLRKLWRPSSLSSLVPYGKKKNKAVFESTSTDSGSADNALILASEFAKIEENGRKKKGGNAIVYIVLVEAKGLPEPPKDGSSHVLHCKIRLGSETFKSKTVLNTHQPEWRERFQLQLNKDHLLTISLWDKGKLKNFMGSCVLDLSGLERERTHAIWQALDDGYGAVHLSITICAISDPPRTPCVEESNLVDCQEKYAIGNLSTDWKLVGELHVKVIAARGLSGKPNAYCVLELDNERVQTHNSRGGTEHAWNKNYVFNVYDVTSTLDLKVYESSLVTSILNDSMGKVSIPLLRICNGETRWYALKDRYKRNSAKGNCPRVRLEMSLYWNPVKASLRLFQPRELKHIKKSRKFDIFLVYKNLEFVRDTFNFLFEINESFKRLFEWDNQELSATALFLWLIFWYQFKLWTAPLLILIPFLYFWVTNRRQQETSFMKGYSSIEDVTESCDSDNKAQNDKSITGRIQGLADMTFTITDGIEYLASVAERLYNLASFKVPFLSYLTMVLLVGVSVVFYTVPYNYIMMSLGIYKFTRKYMNPERILNNDLLDFISRVPDNEILKDWKELSVPEPVQQRQQIMASSQLEKSHSTWY